MTIVVTILAVLVVLCLLCIGHLTNEIATLRRRHEALLLNVTTLQTKLTHALGEKTLGERAGSSTQ